jgi:hypothetical protein
MNDKKDIDTMPEGASITSIDVIDPVWHKPDEETKPNGKLKLFTVSYSELTKKITLDVDGEEYRSVSVNDNISGKRKFYEGVDKMIKLFSRWGFNEISD